MATTELNIIKKQVQKLLPKQKLELIRFLSESFDSGPRSSDSKFITFGKYKNTGKKPSTDADLKIAEWHPTELS